MTKTAPESPSRRTKIEHTLDPDSSLIRSWRGRIDAGRCAAPDGKLCTDRRGTMARRVGKRNPNDMPNPALTPLSPDLVSVRGERPPLRMAVVYREGGFTAVTGAETEAVTGPLPPSALLGYALEPAIYRVRMLQDEPFAAKADED